MFEWISFMPAFYRVEALSEPRLVILNSYAKDQKKRRFLNIRVHDVHWTVQWIKSAKVKKTPRFLSQKYAQKIVSGMKFYNDAE